MEPEKQERNAPIAPPPERVVSYVDGFNLYRGMRQSSYRKYYWLDVTALSRALLKPQQTLLHAKYFTARISGRGAEEKRKRQATYLDALATLPELTVFEGNYRTESVRCGKCHSTWLTPREKQTDVSIATEMLIDAVQGRCDVLLLVSGDSDLIPPIRAIRQHYPNVRVIVAFPPNRFTTELRDAAHGYLFVNPPDLNRSQMPEQVTSKSGFVLRCPSKWM